VYAWACDGHVVWMCKRESCAARHTSLHHSLMDCGGF
jgi:hypothetical protein